MSRGMALRLAKSRIAKKADAKARMLESVRLYAEAVAVERLKIAAQMKVHGPIFYA